MADYAKTILNLLIDKYEESKSFIGQNKVNQRFAIRISDIFSEYLNDSNYNLFSAVNDSIEFIIRETVVKAEKSKRNTFDKIYLNIDCLDKAYKIVGRKTKKSINERLLDLFSSFISNDYCIIDDYCKEQIENINNNKNIKYYHGKIEEIADILKCAIAALQNENEIFIRDFSIKVFKNSKCAEQLRHKVQGLLYDYGDFAEKTSVFEELGILKTPSFITMKGNAIIHFSDQSINLASLVNGIALTAADIKQIDSVKVESDNIVSIENLTSFYTYPIRNTFVIYLGGFHNTIRRELIKKIFECNPKKMFYHFGDIDAGGFLIFEHLKNKTTVPFEPIFMDTTILNKCKDFWSPLTENDKKRLKKIVTPQFQEVIAFMLNNNCKLEQEAIDLLDIK